MSTITDTQLAAYADMLAAHGFTIYEPAQRTPGLDYFTYSRMVDGVECFGTVQSNGYRSEGFREYSHTMPIRPSAKHGSSMYVDGVPDELTLDAALAVARPRNRNAIVGTHDNYRDEYWLDKIYRQR